MEWKVKAPLKPEVEVADSTIIAGTGSELQEILVQRNGGVILNLVSIRRRC